MNDFQLAWRNLWRNKRRTIITAASVFFAVFFALVMRSFQLGAYDQLFKNIIESYSGYLQLQQKDYFDDPIIDNSFILNREFCDSLKKDPNIQDVIPRLESFALASAGSRTQGVIVMGIDPDGENKVSFVKSRLVKYKLSPEAVNGLREDKIPEKTRKLIEAIPGESFSGTGRLLIDLGISIDDTASLLPIIRKHASFTNSYISEDDTTSVLIGDGLSDYLKAKVGDTIVLMGQGYHGNSAAGKYTVKGIVKLPAPDIDNIIIYMPVQAARRLYAAENLATSAVLRLVNNNDENVKMTGTRITKILPGNMVVRDWHELNALLINQMEADNRSGMIMIGILYLVIAFGVFGTVLMMLAERRKEFGMLVSIGMQKRKLAKVISFEMFLIGFLGVAAGVIASLPVIFYGHYNPLRFTGDLGRMYEDYGFEPIMPTLLPDKYFLWQTIVVLIILLIAISFSIRKILRINVINSLRG